MLDVERWAFSALVTGHVRARRVKGWVAQLVEQRTENPRVAGSIPAPATSSQVVAAGSSRTGIVSGGRDLFRAQRSNRIHIRCAARGKKTGKQRSSGEHET